LKLTAPIEMQKRREKSTASIVWESNTKRTVADLDVLKSFESESEQASDKR